MDVPALLVVLHVSAELPSRLALAEVMEKPGAVTSGLVRPSGAGPMELKEGRSLMVLVLYEAATDRPFLLRPGLNSDPYPFPPSLPAAKSTRKSSFS